MTKEIRKYLVNQDNLMLECAADFMQAGWIEVRLASDYAALEAELERAKKEVIRWHTLACKHASAEEALLFQVKGMHVKELL